MPRERVRPTFRAELDCRDKAPGYNVVGTRFTRAKHEAQGSPYANLLKPRAGGLALARQGLYVEPTCAHAAAAFSTLIKNGTISEADKTVVILTGTSLKTTLFYEDQLADNRD